MLPSMRAVGATQEELIELTKNLSVASGVAGLKTQQLLSGVDGLATGTVLANSELGRFLSALGLTNDVLKKSDDLVGLLNGKLGKLKGEITMTQQLSTLKEAWTSTLGIMTKSLWTASKSWIQAIIDYLNQFKEGLKLLPYTYKAMMDTIVQYWNVGVAKLSVTWEAFLLDMKTKFVETFSFMGAELGVAASEGLFYAQDALDLANRQAVGFGANLLKASEGMTKVASSAGTIPNALETVTAETKKATGATKELKKATKDVATEQEKMYDNIQDTLTYGITSMYRSWMDGAVEWKDMMGDILKDILAQLMEVLVVKQLVSSISGSFGGAISMFEKGGAVSNGVQMFASGGVVDSPTAFGMSGGMGIMGEAGAEAIMPITRINGDMGVKVTQAPVNVNIKNYGNDNVNVQQDEAGQIDIVISKVIDSINRGGGVGNAISSRYGLARV